MQNLTSKLQFNGFLFSGKVVSSCSWWHSHHFLCCVLWMSYLFRLMFLFYSSQELHAPFFCTCLTVRRLFSGESSWIVLGTLWCVQWRQMTPSYLLSFYANVHWNVSILFSLIGQYIYHYINNPTGRLQDDY